MPRWFVYINKNQNRKHIKIHSEKDHPCNSIAQHVKENGVYSNDFPIQKNQDIFIIAKTENSHWAIIWAQSLEEVQNNKYLKKVASQLQVPLDKCQNCS